MQLGDIELMKQEEIQEIHDAIAKNNLNKEESYLLYLQSRYWKRLRKKVLARDKACVECGSIHELHVDHKRYPGFGMERLSDLQTLCRVCHQKKSKYKLHEQRVKIPVQEQLWRTMRMRNGNKSN